MSQCSVCHKNAAVIYMTRVDGPEKKTEGICLPCALKKNLPGIEAMLSRGGIHEDNVEEVQERFNQILAGTEMMNPEEIFRSLVNMDPEQMQDLSMGGLADMLSDPEQLQMGADDEDEGDDDPGSNPVFRELMPAQVGSQEEERERKDEHDGPSRRNRKNRKKKFLDQFGRNLTELAKAGKLDPIIGREQELNRVIQILNRRSKNNPALLGEPGVGKTAVAQGLAIRIAEEKVPAKLMDLQIYELDMTAMVAGTQFRGQFESRMKGVVDDARNAGNVVLVIDELHNIMGAGDAEGAMNAANILKPALAAGEICVIGCTTLDEYRRSIEKDSALERRFQKVIINEPSHDACFEILKGIRPYYERHHFVTYSDAVLNQAIELSDRYIHDRFLPDKAIDLLDEAGSRVNLDNRLLADEKRQSDALEEIKEQRNEVKQLLMESREDDQRMKLYERDADLKAKELAAEKELTELRMKIEPVPITKEAIAAVVELWTGIPVRQISEDENEKLLHLEERLHQRLIGQNEAVDAVARAIRRKRAGFGRRSKPSSFLFVGPTGVGKTELAKALAEALFDSEDSLIRLDMSEYMEAHTVSKLIGSPPGYVGYDDAGQLTEKVRRRPYSVLLLDEIEKAHADVYNILLQILDDGRLSDSHGRVISFANCVIIMTSNAGSHLKANTIGFSEDPYRSLQSRVQTVLKETFRPEFLNRIDETIIFQHLQPAEIRAIVDLMLKELDQSLKRQGVTLALTDAAKDALAKDGFDEKFGARPLRRCIQRKLEDPLADLVFSGEMEHITHIKVDYKNGEYRFTFKKKEAK